MKALSYIASSILLSFMVFLIVKGIVRFIRNDRGWRRMEEDRKAKGMPFYGDMEEEIAALEAKQAKYAAVKQGMMQELLTGRVTLN